MSILTATETTWTATGIVGAGTQQQQGPTPTHAPTVNHIPFCTLLNQWWAPRAQWALSAQWKALKRAQTPNGIWPGRKMYTAIYSISPRNLRLGLFRLRKNPLRAPISRIPPKIVAQKLPLGAPLRTACLLCPPRSCIHH